MANLKVKLEGRKTAEKVMESMDEYSFDPIYKEIGKNGDGTHISEIPRRFPTRRIINDLDERGGLHEAYKEYVGMNGVTPVKDMAKRMTNKGKPEPVSELSKEPDFKKGNKITYAIKDGNGNAYPVRRLSERVCESKEHRTLFITDEEGVVTGIYKEK